MGTALTTSNEKPAAVANKLALWACRCGEMHQMMGQNCNQNDAKSRKNAPKPILLTTLPAKITNVHIINRLQENAFF
jgi:hypothetical protein